MNIPPISHYVPIIPLTLTFMFFFAEKSSFVIGFYLHIWHLICPLKMACFPGRSIIFPALSLS